jgi:hypothetical protein
MKFILYYSKNFRKKILKEILRINTEYFTILYCQVMSSSLPATPNPSLIFAREARAYPSGAFLLKNRLPTLLAKVSKE